MADPSRGSERRTVLLIDEDPATGRQVRLALAAPRFSTAVATRPLDGLRLAARQKPHIVLMETRFSQGDALDFARRLMRAPETRSCAVVFYSQGRSLALRVEALQAGVAGFIAKPIDAGSLVQRVDQIVSTLLAWGLPQDVSAQRGAQRLLEVVRQGESEHASGTIELAAGGQFARLELVQGRLRDASFGDVRGDHALEQLVRRGDWQVRFNPAVPSTPSAPAFTQQARPASGLAPQAAFNELGDAPDEEATMIEGAVDFGGPALASKGRQAPELPATGPVPRVDRHALAPVETLEVPTDSNWEAPGNGFDDAETRAGSMPDPSALLEDGASMATERDPAYSLGPQPMAAPVAPAAGDGSGASPMLAPLDDDPLTAFEEDEPTRQALARFRPIVEEESQREVVVPMARAASGGATPALAESSPGERAAWLVALGKPPLLLVIPDSRTRTVFAAAAQAEGYDVLTATSGREAFAIAVAKRPVAVICDAELPDADGRGLLAGVRCDFTVREIPFIIVSATSISEALNKSGAAAVEPVLRGLGAALAPRSELFANVKKGGEMRGWVEPIGITSMLRTLGAAKVSGRLHLRVGETRNAEVILGRGEICGVTVNAPQVSVGPLAMLQLLGYQWNEYAFVPEPGDSARVPLGELGALVETSCRQNNSLLARLYAEGTKVEDLETDRVALDAYLEDQSPQSYELLIRLIEGEPGAQLSESGAAPEQRLKSVLFELRRRAVLRPQSLRPTRAEGLTWSVFTPRLVEAAAVASPITPVRGPRRRRWLVVLVACLTTVILAAGGFFVYRYIKVGGDVRRVIPGGGRVIPGGGRVIPGGGRDHGKNSAAGSIAEKMG